MMIEIDVNGRTRAVTVECAPQADRFRVTLDDQTHMVDARRVEGSTLSLIFVGADAASHEVAIVETGLPGQFDVQLHGAVVRTVVNGRRAVSHAAAVSAVAGARRVVAPMPGRVVRVLVEAGAEVAERQELVVVEAMKMENALGSPKAGRVTEVAVTEGMVVQAGALLVTVE